MKSDELGWSDEQMPEHRVLLNAYLLTVLLCGLAFPLALASAAPSPCYMLVVTVAALFGGRGPGIFAVFLSSAIVGTVFPQLELHVIHAHSIYLQLGAFAIAAMIITEVIAGKQRLAARWMQAHTVRSAFADSCPEAFFTLGSDLRIESVNPAITKMFGYTSNEIIGKPASVLLPEFGQAHAEESTARRKDGQVFTVETSYGHLDQRSTIFLRDITDRKRAQRELEDSKEDMRLILESVPGLLYSRLPNGRIEYANHRASEYFGMTQEEIYEGTWADALHPDEKSAVLDEIARNFAKGEPYKMEYRRRRHDGAYRWFQTSVQPLKNLKGEVVRWYGVLTDVDDLRKAEEALRLTQMKLSQAMQVAVLSELSASVVHEISEPLTAIVANGEACRRWLLVNPPSVTDVRYAVERIVRDGEDMRKIIGTLRDLFRRAPVQKTSLNLDQVIREVLALARARIESDQVIVNVHIPGDLPPVLGDRIQLQQVLMNLVLNALESMHTVTLDRMRLVIRVKQKGDLAVTEIEDRGIGVEKCDKIFDPFFTTKAGGMGMGLSICRSIIEAHEGHLWCEPGAVLGTVFSFTLPLFKEGEE